MRQQIRNLVLRRAGLARLDDSGPNGAAPKERERAASAPSCAVKGAKNLSDALLGRALCAVMRNAFAELRQHRL